MASTYYQQNKGAYWYYLKKAANVLGISYLNLHAVIFLETNRSLSPFVGEKYRGLLQWGLLAAKDLGYSSADALIAANPTYEKQFQIVVKWLSLLFSRKGRPLDLGHLYLMNFLPNLSPKYNGSNATILAENGSSWAASNPALRDSNGNITVASIKQAAQAYYNEAKHLDTTSPEPKPSTPSPTIPPNPTQEEYSSSSSNAVTWVLVGGSIIFLAGGIILLAN